MYPRYFRFDSSCIFGESSSSVSCSNPIVVLTLVVLSGLEPIDCEFEYYLSDALIEHGASHNLSMGHNWSMRVELELRAAAEWEHVA